MGQEHMKPKKHERPKSVNGGVIGLSIEKLCIFPAGNLIPRTTTEVKKSCK